MNAVLSAEILSNMNHVDLYVVINKDMLITRKQHF